MIISHKFSRKIRHSLADGSAKKAGQKTDRLTPGPAPSMKKIIAVTVLWLALLLCSSRGTDLFHITADEQLSKFQGLFMSLVSEDNNSLSKMIACFVLGNDPDGTDQVAIYDHDNFIDFLNAPRSDYDHISITVDEESLTTRTQFRCGKSIHSGGNDDNKTAQDKPYLVACSEIIYECNLTQKTTGRRQRARIKVSMDNVYSDDCPDGIITYLYFTPVPQAANRSSVSQ
jgi:hypothetical protein